MSLAIPSSQQVWGMMRYPLFKISLHLEPTTIVSQSAPYSELDPTFDSCQGTSVELETSLNLRQESIGRGNQTLSESCPNRAVALRDQEGLPM